MSQIDGLTALSHNEVPESVLQQVATGSYFDPHSVLGQHLVNPTSEGDAVTVIRTLRPLASEVSAVLV
jgi:1,4-alpha-glucan branching enzyme